MKLYAVSMVKDEEDVIEHVLYHLVQQGVDGFIIADNMSTDSTPDKLKRAKDKITANTNVNVTIVQDSEVAYRQSEKMTRLGREAASHGATWILPFDADELWYGANGTIKEALLKADRDQRTSVKADYWNHRITRLDEAGNPFVGMRYRESQVTGFYKVLYRYAPNVALSNGNHFITPFDPNPLADDILMRHFPLRSEGQFVKKISNGYHACRALNKNHDLYNGAGWSPYFPVYESEGFEGLKRVYAEAYYDPEGFIYDPAPYIPGELECD